MNFKNSCTFVPPSLNKSFKAIFFLILSALTFSFFSCDGGLFAAHEEVVIKTYNTAPVEEIAKHTVIPPYYGCIIFKVPENVPIESELSFELSIDINGTTYTETLSQGQVLVINNIPVGKVYPVRCTAFLPTGGAYAAGTAEAKVTAGKISNLDLVLRKILRVTFMNGETEYETKTVLSGDSVSKPTTPTRTGFAFSGWYTDEYEGIKFDFGNGVRETLTLYARWVPVSEFQGTSYQPMDPGTDGTAGTEWTYVLFGDWPQTIKADNVDIYEDASVQVGMFTYHMGSDGNWYVKIKENAYEDCYKYTNGDNVAQDSADSYKYFKVEPIKWRVLTENYNGSEKKLLLAENILVNSAYYDYQVERQEQIYPNNYKESRIRAYLNGLSYNVKPSWGAAQTANDEFVGRGFFQTAFTESLRSMIAADTEIDNSARSTNPDAAPNKWNSGKNEYACDNTTDRIFLLSMQEVTTADYGFATEPGSSGNGNARIRKLTDFAKASGARANPTGSYETGLWVLRSPYYYASDQPRDVNFDGDASWQSHPGHWTYLSVVPALCVN